MPSKLEKEVDNLDDLEVVEVFEKVEDYIVPIEMAAKMKNVSRGAIYEAIKKGKLKMLRGIPLKNLLMYTVNQKNRMNGKISVLKKLEGKIKKLENSPSSNGN